MSTIITNEADEVCASCGIKGGDKIKLKRCNACKLVRYCSIACQKEHRPKHKRACRERAAELRNELLFKQPEGSHLGDCPICFIPLPFDGSQSRYHMCCSTHVCFGCAYAQLLHEDEEESQEPKCPFCRTPIPETMEEAEHYRIKRIEANDPVAIRLRGVDCYYENDYEGAFKFYSKAAKLGDSEAHYQLAICYMQGTGGVERDRKKEIHHLEEAAIGGHPVARHNLGILEGEMFSSTEVGRVASSLKHHVIAAKLGHKGSLQRVKEGFEVGLVKRQDLDAVVQAHKASIDATKSLQREEAKQYFDECEIDEREATNPRPGT